MDSETILDLLGNYTRRRIISVLSREPMYFNQLAREIKVGQQAILRHLKSLEDSGLVKTYAEKSSLGAPDRKYYCLNDSFKLTILLSNDDFTMRKHQIVASRLKDSKKLYKAFDLTYQESAKSLPSILENLSEIENEISALESKVNSLYFFRQKILHKLHRIGMGNFKDHERKILYMIIEESPDSLSELSNMINQKENDIKETITSIKDKIGNENARFLFSNLK